MAARKSRAAAARPLFKVRRSKVHGLGVFALRPIKKRTRIIEYLGERISHAVADRRYQDHDESDNHTFLFSVDRGLVIDAGVDGNDARFINHSCGPNCESVIEHRRVYIEALRDIAPGEELAYDYQIGRERGDPPNVDEIYACRCGSAECRGSMLWPPKRPKQRKAKKAAARAAGRASGRSRNERRAARSSSRSPASAQ
ncbi:MAG TPA: SET domain-containing protein-lysine N-methyltransferase [Steroidobacteraceae bacterium]|jgi:SET domain-containing protein|nr:SET domain-containing protein-lysine N-methyltransferase [Steroidobacteraceae bacterium]